MKWRKKKAEGRQRESLAAAGGVRGLVPAPATVRPLTKAQETFRGLLAKVESLRESIDGEEEKLDATLNFYAVEIVPRLARHAALQKDLVRALAPYANETFFPRKQERLEIRELIQEFLNEIAKTENVGRTSASKHANSLACRQLFMQFVNEEDEQMSALFYRALRVIEHGFSARREYLLKDGQTLVGGPITTPDFRRRPTCGYSCSPAGRFRITEKTKSDPSHTRK